MKKQAYWKQAFDFLKEKGEITNQDIIRITNTNCPHSVIRDMRKRGINFKEKMNSKNGKQFKVYIYIPPTENKPIQATDDFTKVSQISLGLNIPKRQLTALELREMQQ